MLFTIKTDKGKNMACSHFMRAVTCLVSFIVIVEWFSAIASAETYIYKDKEGVYRSTDKKPEKGRFEKAKAHTDGIRREGRIPVALANLNEFCRNVVDAESLALISYYRDDINDIRKGLLSEDFSNTDRESAFERLDYCMRQLESRALELRKKESLRRSRESSLRRQEQSFEKLVALVKERLEVRTKNGITFARERFATPVEMQRMTSPLRLEMSSKDVRYLWGRPLWIYGKKGGASETWRYPLGISLVFSNSMLMSWHPYR